MSERRSGRSRKQIDYAKFEADNDDDFADPTPPLPKKKRTLEKTEGRKEKEKPTKATSSDRSAGRKGRLPLDEKLYERDLQAALEISLQGSQSQQDQDDQSSNVMSSHAVLHSTPLVDSHHALAKTEMPDESQSIMPSAIPRGVAADNDIEFLCTMTCSDSDSPSNKPCAATRKKKSYALDEDEGESTDCEDFDDGGSDSDSEFSGADSDFDDVKGKSKKMVKGKPAPANSKPAVASGKNRQSATKHDAGPTRVTPRPTPAVQSKASTSVKIAGGDGVRERTSVTSNPASTKASSVPYKSPVWTPPGRNDSTNNSGSSISLKSPSSGLRLGLSRHARIKPLHPSLKVS